MILSLDIGGTYTRLAPFENNNDIKMLSHPVVLSTNNFSSLENLLFEYEKISGYSLNDFSSFSFAIPGPVTENENIKMLNVKWNINKNEMKNLFETQNIFFLNDFVAQAYGCLCADKKDIVKIKPGSRNNLKDCAVVGAGTGLGHCFMKYVKDINKFIINPSEAGHNIFPFDSNEIEYLNFLVKNKNIKNPTGNDIVSGNGLSYLYEFIAGEYLPANEVVKNIQKNKEILKMFAKFSARAAKHFALSVLTEGSTLFLSGGVFIKNEFLVNNEYFIDEFKSCSLKDNFLPDIEILLIKNQYIALKGAAFYALNQN